MIGVAQIQLAHIVLAIELRIFESCVQPSRRALNFRMNKALKCILIIAVIALVAFCWMTFAVSSIFDVGNGKFYSKQDLINNYKGKQISLYELKDFYNKLVPNDKIVEIEFESNKKIARLAVTNLKSTSQNFSDKYFCDWDLSINSYKVDSILQRLDWTKATLAEIKFI